MIDVESEPRSQPVRDAAGRWPVGTSGNPQGRPRDPTKQLAKDLAPEAVETLAKIMRDETVAAQTRISAASTLLDRAYGRPITPTSEVDSEGFDRPPALVSDRGLAALGELLLGAQEMRSAKERALLPASREELEIARRVAFVGTLAADAARQVRKETSITADEASTTPTEEKTDVL